MANEKKKTSIGGQALIEGIMMRGPFLTSMATRLPDGSIDVETWNTHKGGQKAHWTRRVPFLRGIFNMVDSMVVGYNCLMKSAEKAGVEEEPSKFGIICTKKIGCAVVRNKLRRRVREILRAHGAPFENGVHLVCVLRWRAVEASYADLERDWRKAARKLKLQLLSREQDKT